MKKQRPVAPIGVFKVREKLHIFGRGQSFDILSGFCYNCIKKQQDEIKKWIICFST